MNDRPKLRRWLLVAPVHIPYNSNGTYTGFSVSSLFNVKKQPNQPFDAKEVSDTDSKAMGR